MKDTYNTQTQSKKAEELHYEVQEWKSNLHFINNEIIFIEHLLGSYAFQPNTHNLFERLQNYQLRLKKSKKNKAKIQTSIAKHENNLGGIMECTDAFCDLQYYNKHNAMKDTVQDYIKEFRILKAEIFNYAGSILKKKKPASNS